MDLASPIRSVIPSAYGPVLAALVRAGRPMSGRQIAALVVGQVGRSRVNSVLGELAASGLVLHDSHPPSVLYQFNRAHVAAPFIESLAGLRELLLERLRGEIAGWQSPAEAVWLFGSAARGDGTDESDIDIMVIRQEAVAESDAQWRTQLSDLAAKVTAWTGNSCEILELSGQDLAAQVTQRTRLVTEVRRDAIPLGGKAPATLLD